MAAAAKKTKAKNTTTKASSASKSKALAASRARKKTVTAKAVSPKSVAPKEAPQTAPQAQAETQKTPQPSSAMENVISMFTPEKMTENSPFQNAEAFKDMMSGTTDEWQKIQEKLSGSSEEVMAHVERSSEALSSMASESSEAFQRGQDIASEMSVKSTEASQEAINSWFDFSNRFWSDTIEQSKEFLNCRNANDIFDLQNKLIEQASESLYKQASESSGKLFENFADMADPAQEQASKAAEAFFANLTK